VHLLGGCRRPSNTATSLSDNASVTIVTSKDYASGIIAIIDNRGDERMTTGIESVFGGRKM
jgi:hypothetical protein